MKLLRWAIGGASAASVYAVYRYSIGKKSKGEDVFQTPERAIQALTDGEETETPAPAKPKSRATKAKKPDAG